MLEEEHEAIDEELDAEFRRWQGEDLPHISRCYQFGSDAFMHHCHVIALTRVLIEDLGIAPERIELVIKEVFLSEMRNAYPAVIEKKMESMVPRIILPTDLNPNGG